MNNVNNGKRPFFILLSPAIAGVLLFALAWHAYEPKAGKKTELVGTVN